MDIALAITAGLLLLLGIAADAGNWRIAHLPARSDGGRASPVMAVPTGYYILATGLVSLWLRVYRIHPPYLGAWLVSALVLLIFFDFVCTFNPFERRK